MESQPANKGQGSILPAWFPVVLILAVCIIFIIIALSHLTNTETVLLGVIQTIFSLTAGWLITHAYAKNSEASAVRDVEELYQKNLRVFALKAAEKVENLSRELGRLALYLSKELEESGYESSVDELLAKEERIESAIHLINTLKSVNDTSLSDWRGVIGDEIDEIRQRADLREEVLEKIVDKIQVIQDNSELRESNEGASKDLLREMSKLRRDLSFVASGVTGNLWSAKRVAGPPLRQVFIENCPSCHAEIQIRQKNSVGQKTPLTCPNCKKRLISEVLKLGVIEVRERRELLEHVSCGVCKSELDVYMDESIKTRVELSCGKCGAIHTVMRAKKGLITSLVKKRDNVLTEEIIDRVRLVLPDQPWQKGVHEMVSSQLGIDVSLSRKAINQLILRGIFKDQFQGVLCTPAEKLVLLRSLGKDIN